MAPPQPDAVSVAEIDQQAGPNGYERGKAGRRQLILRTAAGMIAEAGSDGLTIRAIAARAGLSPVTVYNLFGSKHAVLKDLYTEDYQQLVTFFEDHASDDALIRIFDLIDLSARYYLKRLNYHLALFTELIRHSNTDVAVGDWATRSINMQRLLGSAVDAGYLHKDTPVETLAMMFIRVGKSVSQEWVDGSLEADQSRRELGVTYHLILSKFATAKAAEPLAEMAARYGIESGPTFKRDGWS
jgi:AcrR family transcriptional regulator